MNSQNWRNKFEGIIQRNLLTLLVGFLLFGLFAATVVFLSYFNMFNGGLSVKQADWGVFGDFIGGTLNPIFAFLSFIALLMTLLIQNKELVISSEELKKSTDALAQQSRALDLQNFERTFFELIRLHHELVNGVVIHSRSTNYSGGDFHMERTKHQGRECFEKYCDTLSANYHQTLEGVDLSESIQIRIENAYKEFIRYEQNSIGHYFRNLYHIFKFVDESSAAHKQWYASIVRAQLSSHELCLLFYNALMPQNSKFKTLIEKYAVLENINLDVLLDKEKHLPLYMNTAYGDFEQAVQ